MQRNNNGEVRRSWPNRRGMPRIGKPSQIRMHENDFNLTMSKPSHTLTSWIDDCPLWVRENPQVQNSAYGLLKPTPRLFERDCTTIVQSLICFHWFKFIHSYSDSLLSFLLSRSYLLTVRVRRSAPLGRQKLSQYFSCVRNHPLECSLFSPLTDSVYGSTVSDFSRMGIL